MLLFGADEDVCAWVSTQLMGNGTYYVGDKAIGIVKNGELIAGVVYSNYTECPYGLGVSIEMSIATIDKSWATRHNLRALFGYPFIQLKLKRVHAVCSAHKGDTMKFLQKLGFRQEGYHIDAWPMGGDAASFGMLRSECKWVR